MRSLIREPLVHFTLIGVALFVLYGLVNEDARTDVETLVVSEGQVEHLAATFAKVWQRQPTALELKGLVDEHVKEEVISREAIKLGLDRNTTLIRPRLRQKMEFIAQDIAENVEPPDAELKTYLAERPETFREPSRYTFRHIYFSPDRRGPAALDDANEALTTLQQTPDDFDAIGDSILVPGEFDDEPLASVAAQLGKSFADALPALEIGIWTGPVESGYGVHLVFIENRTEGVVPAFSEIRDRVQREWLNDRRHAADRAFIEALLEQYDVTVRWPGSDEVADEGPGS